MGNSNIEIRKVNPKTRENVVGPATKSQSTSQGIEDQCREALPSRPRDHDWLVLLACAHTCAFQHLS